jgi:D-alanine--poly(phosphoribitol) ligase subunit 1
MQINILEYFENGGAKYCAGKVAIVDGERSYAFAELERNTKRCAALLIHRCDVIRQPIAVFLPKCAEGIFADLGILYSGNIFCNLDIKSPLLRIQGIINNVRPVLIITSRALKAQLTAMGISDGQIFLIDEIYDESVAYDTAALWGRLGQVIDTDPACIIHTSGSTGLPKGVVLSHRGVIDFMDWCFARLKLAGSERIGSLSPFCFDIYILELVLCLAKGATIVLVAGELAAFPVQLVQFLADRRISFIFWVPSIMVTISAQGLLKGFDLSALKTIFFAGEVFPMKHLNNWRRQLRGAVFVNLYGPIEITVDCTYFVVDREFSDDDALPIGFPCRNTDILILNEQNEPCELGERGELCVRGSSLAMGYWNDPDKTARAFVQNPLNTHYPELIYRTGDLVFRNERNEIMFVGRKDFQIKHMGYRIELSEIEYQTLAIEGISNACVLYNQEQKEITLFYETPDAGVTPALIRQKLLKLLPKYMLPTAFHRVDELPRNPNGKIDRNGLSAIVLEMANATGRV